MDFSSNRSPLVSIVWPKDDAIFSFGTIAKLEVDASDPDGSIREVQYFADTNLIAVATEPPYSATASIEGPGSGGTLSLKAVAIDNSGARADSRPVRLYYVTGAATQPVLEIRSPREGELFASPATFQISAELLASVGESGPVDLYVDGRLVARAERQGTFTVATSLYALALTNLLEGTHELQAKYMGINQAICICRPITVSVVRLGVRRAMISPNGTPQFEVVTAFAGRDHALEASQDLANWTPISTNRPANDTFLFTGPRVEDHTFYRVRIPP